MTKHILPISLLLAAASGMQAASFNPYAGEYTPSEEVIQSRREFAGDRCGIFLPWGL